MTAMAAEAAEEGQEAIALANEESAVGGEEKGSNQNTTWQ